MKNNSWAIPVSIILGALIISIGLYAGQVNKTSTFDIEDFKKQLMAEQEKADKEANKVDMNKLMPISKDEVIRGNEDAEITIIEYSDFDCPFCARFHNTMKELISENNNIKWVYRHFPLSFHPNAEKKAVAVECAKEQGKYWESVDLLLEKRTPVAGIPNAFAELGIDKVEFEDCFNNNKTLPTVKSHVKNVIELGGRGTPFSVIIDKNGNATPVSGAVPLPNLKAQINALN